MALSQKGKEVLQMIAEKLKEGDTFKTKDLGVSAQSLTSLIKDGYVEDLGGKPKTYKVISTVEIVTYKTDYAPYTIEEMKLQYKMTYNELCDYLLDKYGTVNGNYFSTEKCSGQNKNILRWKEEGLQVHHIMEDTYILLGNSKYAQGIGDFTPQLKENLLYCNVMEHFLLHIRIAVEYGEKVEKRIWEMTNKENRLEALNHQNLPITNQETGETTYYNSPVVLGYGGADLIYSRKIKNEINPEVVQALFSLIALDIGKLMTNECPLMLMAIYNTELYMDLADCIKKAEVEDFIKRHAKE